MESDMLEQKSYSLKQVLLVREDLTMRKGKIAAQAAHASMGAFMVGASCCVDEDGQYFMSGVLTKDHFEWYFGGHAKITLGVKGEEELLQAKELAKKAGLPYYLVVDSGKTEFHGVPTTTVLCIGPAKSDEIDKITGPNGLVKTRLI
jgi:PTH2 family peptidyl-tRNA hydrolase